MRIPIEIEDNHLSLIDELEDETIDDHSRSAFDLRFYKFRSKGFNKLEEGCCIINKNMRQIIRRGWLARTLYFLADDNYGLYFNCIKVFPFSELKLFGKGIHPAQIQIMQDQDSPKRKRQERMKKLRKLGE